MLLQRYIFSKFHPNVFLKKIQKIMAKTEFLYLQALKKGVYDAKTPEKLQ